MMDNAGLTKPFLKYRWLLYVYTVLLGKGLFLKNRMTMIYKTKLQKCAKKQLLETSQDAAQTPHNYHT